jgi:hypothetical protein
MFFLRFLYNILWKEKSKMNDSTSDVQIGLDYQLSPNFNVGMLVRTDHRDWMERNKTEGMNYVENMSRVCTEILEPVNKLLGPIFVTSCFRCLGLNKAIGGALNSQHRYAEAADIVFVNRSGDGFLKAAFNTIASSQIIYSQLIYEFGWVHVGITNEKLYPGKKLQKLQAFRINGKTTYRAVTGPI